MKPRNDRYEPFDPEPSPPGFIRGFFRVLTMLAAAFLAGFLILTYLNKSNAPASPELTMSRPESGAYVSVTPEKGPVCSVLSAEAMENVTARLVIDADGSRYRSEPLAKKLKLSETELSEVSFDPAKLRYYPSGLSSSEPVTAKELIVILPNDAAARIVFSVDDVDVLESASFFLIPFLTGGSYES